MLNDKKIIMTGIGLDLSVKLENQIEERLSPGVWNVEISGVVEKEDNNKQYIEIGFVNPNGVHNERMYVTDSAKDYTMYKLQQISLSCGYTLEQISLIKTIKQLCKALVGKQIGLKLSGQEKEVMKDGVHKRYIYSYIGLGKFCTPIDKIGDLSFNNNERGAKGDIKYLPTDSPKTNTDIPSNSIASNSDDDGDELPF